MTNAFQSVGAAVAGLHEAALVIDADLGVKARNRAAADHPVFGLANPFSSLPDAERRRIGESIRAGAGAALCCGADPGATHVRLLSFGEGAIALLSSGRTKTGVEGFAEEQLGALIATAVDGIMCIDERGRAELFNPACERIFGYSAGEVLGRNIRMLMPPKYADNHDGYIDSYVTTGVKKIIGIGREVEGRRKNGEVFPMDLSVGEFRHEGVRRFVGMVRDLSARAASERRVQELQNQVAHMGRVSAVAEMGSALAHELNQPLTAMTLYLTAAERALAQDAAKASDLFGRAKAEAARAGEIVRRIRQMVERSDHEMARFRLLDVVAASIVLCRIADAERNCVFEVEDLPEDFDAFGDATQIQQILVNLLKNALDATAGRSERRIRVSMRAGAAGLELFVEDNGPGIAPEIRERLFSPFTSSKAKGLGIGLSICRNIAEGHGGTLDLIEAAGREDALGGACFRLRLPQETIDG